MLTPETECPICGHCERQEHRDGVCIFLRCDCGSPTDTARAWAALLRADPTLITALGLSTEHRRAVLAMSAQAVRPASYQQALI